MDDSMVRKWHDHVQPLINAKYKPWSRGANERRVRADVHWNWWRIRNYAALHNFATRWRGNKSGKAAACCLKLVGEDAGHAPIGMLTVVPRFNCTVDSVARDRGFIWYLSDAPEEHYHRLGIEPASGVAKALIDTALRARLDLGLDGATLLCADRRGGSKLRKFYEHGCGMTPVSGRSTKISPLRFSRSGDYFTMDDAAARSFCRRYDANRI
jgi:hypothetical protein